MIRRLPRAVSSVVAVVFLTSGLLFADVLRAGASLPAPVAPGAAMSIYVVSQSNAELCAWGDALATKQSEGSVAQDALLLMHFFAPIRKADGSYGASRRTGRDASVSQIRWSAQMLISCWEAREAANGLSGAHLTLGVGVTNDDTYHAVTLQHGRAWAGMVDALQTWIVSKSFDANSDVGGAFDAEPGFGRLKDAKQWVRGYRSLGTPWPIYYYGGAAGCPTRAHHDWHCQWDPDGIIWLAWGNGITQPIPEIYDKEPWTAKPPASLNAQQWAWLSRRAAQTGAGPIGFAGALSQHQACKEVGGCGGIDLAPKNSWRDLWNTANCAFRHAAACSTETALRWVGDISWADVYPGSTPVMPAAVADGAVRLARRDRHPRFDPFGARPAEQGIRGFHATDTWLGVAGGEVVEVDAGREGRRAGVLIWRRGGAPRFVPVPGVSGTLRITGVARRSLNFRDGGGARYHLDLMAGRSGALRPGG